VKLKGGKGLGGVATAAIAALLPAASPLWSSAAEESIEEGAGVESGEEADGRTIAIALFRFIGEDELLNVNASNSAASEAASCC